MISESLKMIKNSAATNKFFDAVIMFVCHMPVNGCRLHNKTAFFADDVAIFVRLRRVLFNELLDRKRLHLRILIGQDRKSEFFRSAEKSLYGLFWYFYVALTRKGHNGLHRGLIRRDLDCIDVRIFGEEIAKFAVCRNEKEFRRHHEFVVRRLQRDFRDVFFEMRKKRFD